MIGSDGTAFLMVFVVVVPFSVFAGGLCGGVVLFFWVVAVGVDLSVCFLVFFWFFLVLARLSR